MTEYLLAGIPLLLVVLAAVQLSLLWMGKGVVDAAAHLAARKFALAAREDPGKARQSAFSEADRTCRNRPGVSRGEIGITTLNFTRDGERPVGRPSVGDPICVQLTHGVELVVPWVNRILYAIFPGEKLRLGDRFILMIRSSRWVTVE